ncbi:MAG: hypothetical protein ACRETX_17475, partial [Steroidobacteraceae bacterium]
CRVSYELLLCLAKCPLLALDLSQAKLVGESAGLRIRPLLRCRELSLRGVACDKRLLTQLLAMPSLVNLELTGCKSVDLDVFNAVLRLPAIANLRMAGCTSVSFDKLALPRLPRHLELLDLMRCPQISRDALEALEKAHPWCSIGYAR